MKKIVTIAAMAGCIACNENNTGNTFEVEGSVKNTTAKMIYLEEVVPNSKYPVIMDSSDISGNGGFELEAKAGEESFYQLRLQSQLMPFAFLINDAKKVTVKADLANSDQPYTVQGSAASEALVAFDRTTFQQGLAIYTLGSKVDSLKKANAPDSLLTAAYQQLEDKALAFKSSAREAIEKSKSPVLTLYTLSSFQNRASKLNMTGFSPDELKELVFAAAAQHPQHTGLQTVKAQFASAPKAGAAASPRRAPEFSQPDINGQPVSLSSFRGKYVLLDFWASWCRPCREENPNVVAAYNQFKDKNFTVFGVSLDENKEAWQKAIDKDGLTWTHASDLQFWNNAAATLYGVQSIPANFLIDPQGNIIAQDLRGEELVKTLEKHLK
jgi:peroxiredoxin